MTRMQAPISMRERLQTDYHWTTRQREVLNLLSKGRTNSEIGGALGISLAGAKWHVSEVMSKLQAGSREEAAEYWRRYNGLAPRFARVFRGAAPSLPWVATATGLTAAGTVLLLGAVLLLNGDDSRLEQAASPAVTATAMAPGQASVTPGTGGQDTLIPAPAGSGACPVDPDACAVVGEIVPLVLSGNAQGLMALAEPDVISCGGEPTGNRDWGCFGAAPGERREGFWWTEAGEGSFFSPEVFESRLGRFVEEFIRAGAAGSAARDAYGTGEARLASIRCFRTQGPAGTCTGESLTAVFTAIDTQRPANLQRVVACVGMAKEASGRYRVKSAGWACSIPPYMSLYSFATEGSVDESTHGIFETYPWSP